MDPPGFRNGQDWTWTPAVDAPDSGEGRHNNSLNDAPPNTHSRPPSEPVKPQSKQRRATMHHLSPGYEPVRAGSPSAVPLMLNGGESSRTPSPSNVPPIPSYPYNQPTPPRSPRSPLSAISLTSLPLSITSPMDDDHNSLPGYTYPHAPSFSQRFANLLDSETSWLILYFFCNLSLTLYNKIVLVRFPFPYTLTALHTLCGSIGCYILLERGVFEPKSLSRDENIVLLGFSVLYTINIAVSNLSLGLVTVPFHQVVRSTTPVFAMMISFLLLRAHFSSRKIISLIPVIAGVGLATYGDYYFTAWGLILTLIGTFLAALKTVLTNVLQTAKPITPIFLTPFSSNPSSAGAPSLSYTPPRLHLHPLDLLFRMSPLAFIQCVIFSYLSGELDRVRAHSAVEMTASKAFSLLMNGILAFALNIVSFTANKKVGALSMTVAANVKQVLTIVFAVSLFDLKITFVNSTGILLTIIGGAWYAGIEYKEKQQRRWRTATGQNGSS